MSPQSAPLAPDPTADMARECGRALLGMSKELNRAGEVCAMLETKVSQIITHYSGDDKLALMEELQHLDILNQLICALASYASVVGQECSAGQKPDLAAASELIGLARVAARLGNNATHDGRHGEDAQADSGEMHLF